MSIRVSAFTIDVGFQQMLEMSRGEDREFRLTFQDGGAPVDMTGAQSVVLTVRNRTTGIEMFARNYSGFQGAASAGTPRFQVLQADTVLQQEVPYDVDVVWTDASGYREQLLVASTFLLLQGVGDPSDPLTTPPAIPVVYGLNWLGFWTSWSGGYQVNDAVQAYDGSIGGTGISSFRDLVRGVTAYPITASGTVASGWAYVARAADGGGDVAVYGGASLLPNAATVLNAGRLYLETVDKILYFVASGSAGATYYPIGAYS